MVAGRSAVASRRATAGPVPPTGRSTTVRPDPTPRDSGAFDDASASVIGELLDRLERQSLELTALRERQARLEALLARARSDAQAARVIAADERALAQRLETELAKAQDGHGRRRENRGS
jgi:hypothetical protein